MLNTTHRTSYAPQLVENIDNANGVCVSVRDGRVTDEHTFRSREPAHVGASAGLTQLVLRRRESASAVGNWHGGTEQPLCTARGTPRLHLIPYFSRDISTSHLTPSRHS